MTPVGAASTTRPADPSKSFLLAPNWVVLAMLVTAVKALPARCRQVFTLRKVYGYTQREIAARMGITENTVEQQLAKAVRHCAQALFDQSLAERRATLLDRFRRRGQAHDQSE